MTALWASVIAVAGTLLGGLLAGVVQVWTARGTRQATVSDQRRGETVSAVTTLAVALADHRRATWVAERTRLVDADEQAQLGTRAAAHETWSAVTGPLVMVKVLAPQFAVATDAVTEAIYAMVDAPDQDTLEARRADARAAHDRLVQAASAFFTAEPVPRLGQGVDR